MMVSWVLSVGHAAGLLFFARLASIWFVGKQESAGRFLALVEESMAGFVKNTKRLMKQMWFILERLSQLRKWIYLPWLVFNFRSAQPRITLVPFFSAGFFFCKLFAHLHHVGHGGEKGATSWQAGAGMRHGLLDVLREIGKGFHNASGVIWR